MCYCWWHFYCLIRKVYSWKHSYAYVKTNKKISPWLKISKSWWWNTTTLGDQTLNFHYNTIFTRDNFSLSSSFLSLSSLLFQMKQCCHYFLRVRIRPCKHVFGETILLTLALKNVQARQKLLLPIKILSSFQLFPFFACTDHPQY